LAGLLAGLAAAAAAGFAGSAGRATLPAADAAVQAGTLSPRRKTVRRMNRTLAVTDLAVKTLGPILNLLLVPSRESTPGAENPGCR
jgi:hypothetical protein